MAMLPGVRFNVYGKATVKIMFRCRDEWPQVSLNDETKPEFLDLGYSVDGVDIAIYPRHKPMFTDGSGGRAGAPRDLARLNSDGSIRMMLAKYDPDVLDSLRNLQPGVGPGSGEAGTLVYGNWVKSKIINPAGEEVTREVRGYVRLLIEGTRKTRTGAARIAHYNFPTVIVSALEDYRGRKAAYPSITFAAYRRQFNGTNDAGNTSYNTAVLMNESSDELDPAEPII